MLTPLSATVAQMEKSVQHMSDKFDEITQRLDTHDKEIQCLKKRADRIDEEQVFENQKTLREAVNDLEWRSRRLNLEIHGIPATPNENLLQKVNALAPVLDVPLLDPSSVTAIHRLPARPGKIPGVIVRYNRQAERDAWLRNRKKLRESKQAESILENMTKQNRELLRTTKEWASENGFRFVWHANNRILLRKNTGDDVIVVKSNEQLHQLTQ